ncbi:inorganic triphosphatase [Serratia microhaemolytica]|uniref:CYTH domain-containing protein n=1 Tax=Serratia microhaemolytica TaxID=2675110 RepID=UPI000FDD08F5|nr:inorganic triphosphatase [Serratia microhaemolytica]
MSVEIELKFIVSAATVATLPQRIAIWPHRYSAAQKLTNIYFESADHYLRMHHMALRIRGTGQHYEMTIKTSGSVVAGVHQRPEYNVVLSQPELDLAKFPADIWPEGCQPQQLQAQLQPRFSTNFSREKWLVTFGSSQIEVALDLGEVSAGERQEPICELELELTEGNVADLLAFAGHLAQFGGLRQSSLSKAARGYRLAQGDESLTLRPLNSLQVAAKSSVEQGMIAAFEWALSHWQYHEELWLQGQVRAKGSVQQAVALIRQILVTFGGLIPRRASCDLRAQLTTLEPLLQVHDTEPQQLCYSTEYLHTKLLLTSWLLTTAWRPFIEDKAKTKLNSSFKRFCDIMLSRCSSELKSTFGHPLNQQQYQQQLPRLERLLLSLLMLSGAYPESLTAPYLEGWRQLQLAITTQHQSEWETRRRQALRTPFWLHST